MERNDNKFVEDATIAFAMYCDDHGMTQEEGDDFAERLADELANVASDRPDSEAPEVTE